MRVAERRAPGTTRSARAGVLIATLLALTAVPIGCGENEPSPVIPVLPPPRPPPPPPPSVDTVYVGFAQDRIEITEGLETSADIDYDVYYADPPDPRFDEDRYRFALEMIVEPGSGSAGDLLETSAWIGHGFILEPGTTWIPLQALADGLAEETEVLTLRMRPVQSEHRGYPPAIEVVNPTLEVVIRDEAAAGVCSNVRIRGTRPRNIARPDGAGSCPAGEFETRITLEADVGDPVYVDRAPPYGRIYGWRVASDGARIRHDLALQWSVVRTWELRLEACPGSARGPTLVCTVEKCETYPAGAFIPPTRIPARCR